MNSDNPIVGKKYDKFNRASFAIRLGKVIEMKSSSEPIIAAIYSEWGNGKSSVLNMVEESLSDEIVTVRFNPWRYDDQDQLIVSFFNSIVQSIEATSIKKKEDLKKKFKKYGASAVPLVKMIPLIGAVTGGVLESVTKLIEEKSTEKFKHELNELLIEEKTRIVIIIDDIDRLDKDEALNLLKLIKLNGDFAYVSYLLAFDKNILEGLVSEKYTYSNKRSGSRFLEKIIQIPVELPKIRFDELLSFTHKHIEKSLEEIGVKLKVGDYEYFSSYFDKYLIHKVRLPRDAIRISNVIKFVVPILLNEVYTPDVMILEIIKLFYPSAYEAIESHPELFVETDKDFGGTMPSYIMPKYDKKKVEEDIYVSCDSEFDQNNLRTLFHNLFPLYHQNTSNYQYDHSTRTKWMAGQKVASSKYLNRYLSLSIAKGDIPDAEFFNLITVASGIDNQDETSALLRDLFSNFAVNYIIHRLRSIESTIDGEAGFKLAIALGEASDLFDAFDSIFLSSVGNSSGQASIFIKSVFSKYESDELKAKRICKVISSSSTVEFGFSLVEFIRMKPKYEDQYFDDDLFLSINECLIHKILSSVDSNSNVFAEYPKQMQLLVGVWNEINNEEMIEYVEEKIFAVDADKIFDLILIFFPTRWSSIHPEPYWGDLSKDGYTNLVNLFNINKIVGRLQQVISVSDDKDDLFWLGDYQNNQNKINMARQVIHFYETSLLEEE